MKPLTVVTTYNRGPFFKKALLPLTESALVERIVIVSQEKVNFQMDKCCVLVEGPLSSYETLNQILKGIQTNYLLLLPVAKQILIESKTLEKFLGKAESTEAGLVYSDFYDGSEFGKTLPS